MEKSEKLDLTSLLAAAPTEDYLAKACAALFAVGLSVEQTSRCLKVGLGKVETLRQSEVVNDMVLSIQVAMSMSPEQRLAAAVNAAIDVKMKLLQSEDEKVASAASAEILDRVQGKPVQTTQSISVQVQHTTGGNIDSKLQALNERLAALQAKRTALVNAKAAKSDIINV